MINQFYFPKFFHPIHLLKDNQVLKPEINNSKNYGSSLTIPYFFKLDKSKDFTVKTSVFDSDMIMFQNEFRLAKEKTSYLTDFGFTNGYKSSSTNKKKKLNHIFFKLNHDLDLRNFNSSETNLSFEKTIMIL